MPKQTHKVMNWRAHDASLRQRGSLTAWFTDETIEASQAEHPCTNTHRGIGTPRCVLG